MQTPPNRLDVSRQAAVLAGDLDALRLGFAVFVIVTPCTISIVIASTTPHHIEAPKTLTR
jgi:hypothetical protein